MATDAGLPPKIAIIIAHTRSCVQETLRSLARQSYPHDRFEAIIVGAAPQEVQADQYHFGIRYLVCDDPNPSVRRNLAMNSTDADIFAFIDDDARADENWCSNAVALFQEHASLTVVGGPTLLPEGLGLLHLLTYKIAHAGFFGNGHENLGRESTDLRDVIGYLTSCNMFVMRSRLEKHNGFTPEIGYGGEDTVFLFETAAPHPGAVRYSPTVIVYHSRGRFGWTYLKTRFIYRYNNGAMLWARPGIYLRNRKFAVGLALGVILSAVLLTHPWWAFPVAIAHLLISFGYSIRYLSHDWRLTFLFPPSLLTQHVVYFAGLVIGFFSIVQVKQFRKVMEIKRRLRMAVP